MLKFVMRNAEHHWHPLLNRATVKEHPLALTATALYLLEEPLAVVSGTNCVSEEFCERAVGLECLFVIPVTFFALVAAAGA